MSCATGFQHNMKVYTAWIKPISFAAFLAGLMSAMPARSQPVEAHLPNALTITANYHEGIPSRPAVLLLHGFLQTFHSPPMSTLADNLSSKGYTTLSPTLSLGVNRRSQSSPCEAVHTQTMDAAEAEISYWVNWLQKKGHGQIALLGFSSTGNISLIQYQNKQRNPAVKKLILTSFNPMVTDPVELQKARTSPNARKLNDKPVFYTLGYCKRNFAAPEMVYMSYAQYTHEKILGMLRQADTPMDIIFGASDGILPAGWMSLIRQLRISAKVVTLENANHFFDGPSEFDLAESVEQSLKSMQAKRP